MLMMASWMSYKEACDRSSTAACHCRRATPPAASWAPEDAKGLVMAGCGCTALPCLLVVAVSAGTCKGRGCCQLL